MTAFEFEAVVFDRDVYCVICLPPQVSLGDPEVIPIPADRIWEKAPTCCKCGRAHEDVLMAEEAFV